MSSQGFDCELDDFYWLSCSLDSGYLHLDLIENTEFIGRVSLGLSQVENLIEYLENVKVTLIDQVGGLEQWEQIKSDCRESQIQD